MNGQRLAIGIGALCILGGWGAGIYGVTHLLKGGGLSLFPSPPAPPVVRTPRSQIIPLPKGLDAFMGKARTLAPADVERLKARVLKNPGDAPARALLMAYSMFAPDDEKLQRLHREEAVWFAANLPASPALDGTFLNIDGFTERDTFRVMARLFDEALPKLPKSADLRHNYAELLLFEDKPRSIRLYEDAAKLDPRNPDRYDRLAFAHVLASHRRKEPNDPVEAAYALDAYLKAQTLGGEPTAEYFLEAALAADRIDVATREAAHILKGKPEPCAAYAAHTALGLLALKRNDVATARGELRLAGNLGDEVSLTTSGFDLALAKALLERGERDTVATFLRKTLPAWADARKKGWTQAVLDGKIPDWD